jgi:Ni2+-binding GTPase involved in maturation of urease and hydrogenase
MQNEKVKVLMLTGPPGSGKNSMVELYCKRYNI